MRAQGALRIGEGTMFGLKRKARKAQAQVDAVMPQYVEVWWRGHVTHPWQFLGRYDRLSEAQAAARHMTIAQVDIRETY